MKTGERLALVAAAAVLAGGVAGAATVNTARDTNPHRPAVTALPGTATTTAPVPTTGPPSGPGPSSAALGAGMLAPVDLGGFYRVNDPYAEGVLSTAPCLAGVGPSPAQNGRAVVGLMVPGGHPAVTEVAASYPGATAVQVYHSINQSLAACTAFPVSLGGDRVTVHITPQNLPQVADASSAYGGTFNASGRNQSLQVEVVLDAKIVVVVVYVDTVPPSNAIYGDLQSTAAAAVGKLA